jgi:phage-related tail protein
MGWTKGTSGNPGGRTKEKPFRDALRMQIAAAGDDHKALRAVAQALLNKAAAGDVSAIHLLADRLDGRLPQSVGGSEELGPQRLQISWKSQPYSETAEVVEAVSSSVLAIAAPVAEGDD